MFGDKAQYDGIVVGDDLFKYTEATGKLAKTSCVNFAQFQEHFKKLLAKADYVIHFSLSSDMSASYANAVQASKDYPGKVFVIDSRTLSTGIALQCIYAKKLIDAGKDVKEVVRLVQERIPATQASFGLEAVNYLYKGGRCSAMAALGANILHIRPQIIVKDGKMISGKKFRGPMEKWVMDYVETTLKNSITPITKKSSSLILPPRKRWWIWCGKDSKKAGFKHIMNTYASGTVSCHCGPHTLGILYFNDGPHPIA
jgi:DegV family protein with EDD domain